MKEKIVQSKIKINEEFLPEISDLALAAEAYSTVVRLLDKYPSMFLMYGSIKSSEHWIAAETWLVITRRSDAGTRRTRYNLTLEIFSSTGDGTEAPIRETIHFSEPQPYPGSYDLKKPTCKITFSSVSQSKNPSSTIEIPNKGKTQIEISKIAPMLPIQEMLNLLNQVGSSAVTLEVGGGRSRAITYEEHLARRKSNPALNTSTST